MSEHHHWHCITPGSCECASRPCCCDGCPRTEAGKQEPTVTGSKPGGEV